MNEFDKAVKMELESDIFRMHKLYKKLLAQKAFEDAYVVEQGINKRLDIYPYGRDREGGDTEEFEIVKETV